MMQLEIKLQRLRHEMNQMWKLVLNQFDLSKQALDAADLALAKKVIKAEKKVNAQELKIDQVCENIFALYNPVAIDLRYVLAVLKINASLEQVGNTSKAIAKFVLETSPDFDRHLLELSQVDLMFEKAKEMVELVQEAFQQDDATLARLTFRQDKTLNKLNMQAHAAITEFISSNPEKVKEGFQVLSFIRRLERVGEHSKDIAQEIIYFVEAKVLKHLSKKDRKRL